MRLGIPIARSKLNDLVHRAAEILKPLYDALLARIVTDPHCQADETSFRTTRDFYPNGPLVPTSDVACGLTMIKARWISDSPDPLGWDNGVYLRNSTQYWRMTASNGRTGEADCYR